MLNPSDIYTSVGSANLYGCWTTPVTKFDTSSFYNWEQDNLPVLDLEERTSLLWERLGHPTSSINGFALVVSADAASSCNSNIFKTLSACLATVPEVINAPYLIEVASYGDLGPLVLSNKIFGPRGSIEIINRGFSKADSTGNGTDPAYHDQKITSQAPYNLVGLASAIVLNTTSIGAGFLASAQLGTYTLPTIQTDFKLSKVYSLNQLIASSNTYDSRLTTYKPTIFSRKNSLVTNRLTASLAARNTTVPFTSYTDSGGTKFTPYETNPDTYETQLGSHDASCINDIDQSELIWKNTANSLAVAFAYTNSLSELKIYNCNGPIYIRNFTVDGKGSGGKEYGIDIRNSSVLLENCSVARCNKAGLYSQNSQLILTRGFIAYRNYGFNSDNTRKGRPWLQKVKSENYYNNQSEFAAGLDLVNTDLYLSSTYDREIAYNASALSGFYGLTGLIPGVINNALRTPPPAGWLFCFSRNDIGLRAINSRIYGGRSEVNSKTSEGLSNLNDFLFGHNLICELNTEAGLSLENSKIDYSGRIGLFGNFRGLDSLNSNISIGQIDARNNQKEAVLLSNSRLNYNKDCYRSDNTHLTYGNITYNIHQMGFLQNGTHLRLINSTFEPTDTSSIPSNYERFVASGSFGVDHQDDLYSTQESILPSIIVDSNSKLRLISPGIENSQAFSDSDKAVFGAAISVNDNSELIVQGTSAYVTKIVGPNDYAYQYKKSGLFANNNSTIKIQGPTVIAKYGVDILVDNNSHLEITPHKKIDGTLDVSGFNLATKGNHTTVELHATRACIVADKGSTVLMKDLGNYANFWGNGSYGASALVSGIDYDTDSNNLNYARYVSAGSLQFYPNPNDQFAYTNSFAVDNPTIGIYDSQNDVKNNTYLGINYILPIGSNIGLMSNNYLFSGVTNGGMCLRALNGSKVKVDNVHFPAGWWNPSSVIYESSAVDTNCSKLFIWNMADLSQLDAKYIIVSGQHPADAAYFGPTGVWSTTAGVFLSGAPSGTPDTSSLSVLDYYGRAPSAHRYANTVATNQGPFRIYFSVDPSINWAVATQTPSLEGVAKQVYSQGYNFSGNLYYPGNVSSFYKSVLTASGSTNHPSAVRTDGFIYASSIVLNPFTQRILLDDSAANTFANSKHNTVGKSGLAKTVAIYFPYNDVYGGDSANAATRTRGHGVKSVNTFDLDKDN